MTKLQEDMEYVQSKIDNEGFDYTFTGYSDFETIKDKKFHELRKAYIKAQEDLESYIEGVVEGGQ